jgi:hypothetical protein
MLRMMTNYNSATLTTKKDKSESSKIRQQATAGFAILGQQQYPSALVRYWALAQAEVFHPEGSG